MLIRALSRVGLVIVLGSCARPLDPALPGAGPRIACGACITDMDCDAVARCIDVQEAKACVPRCEPSKGGCPSGFDCQTPASGGQAACAPTSGSCCVDQDGDGCGRGVGCRGLDCDDTDATISPEAPEVCNGRDDNCDGQIDEGFGQVSCGVGECARTVDRCADGQVQACTPGSPSLEICNGADDDCDGLTDENFGSSTCGIGECRRTVQNCLNGLPQACTPGSPARETCNGRDDDCNGREDDADGGYFYGYGPACMHWCPACYNCDAPPVVPETCNGWDDDCDGEIDEGLGQTTCGVGACERTVQNCLDRRPQTCVPGTPGIDC